MAQPATFTRSLEDTLNRALSAAKNHYHEYATIEHLLLALVDDADASRALTDCGADLDELRRMTQKYIDQELDALVIPASKKKRKNKTDKEALAKYEHEGPAPTSGFQRIIQRAILHTQASGISEVNGSNVLVALLSERESYAAYFLQQQDISRLDIVSWLSRGAVKQAPNQDQDEGQDPEPLSESDLVIKILKNDLIPLPDSVATEPLLATPRIADKIVEFVLDLVTQSALRGESSLQTSSLVTVGVFGPWGSGKSTLLRSIASRLSDEDVLPVFINTWKWSGTEDIYNFVNEELMASLWRAKGFKGISLLLRFALLVRANSTRITAWLMVCAAVLFLYFGIDWKRGLLTPEAAKGSVVALASAALVAVFAKPVGSLIERVILQEANAPIGQDRLSRAYRYLGAIRSRIFRAKNRPVAFIFDDLDRCGSQKVVDFFKSIHTLTATGSICVVACDEEFAAAAIYHEFKEVAEYLEEGRGFGARFLEKMVQVPFRLPEITADDLRVLRLAPLAEQSVPEAESLAPSEVTPRQVIGEAARSGPTADVGEEARELVSEIRLSQICGDVLALVVEPCRLQIRQVKMISNVVKLYAMIFPPTDEASAQRMVTFLVVSYVDPEWIPRTYFGDTVEGAESPLDDLRSTLTDLLGADPAPLRLLYRLFGAGQRWKRPVGERSSVSPAPSEMQPAIDG